MMPEASATKAKQILEQMLEAMGGQAFFSVRESQCTGRVSQFGHNNDLTSYLEFKDYWRYPDKNRTDFGKKGNIIDLFNGKEGWTVDHDGVSEDAGQDGRQAGHQREALGRDHDQSDGRRLRLANRQDRRSHS